LGVTLYFDSSSELRKIVILDPQWLVTSLTKVIRDFKVHTYTENEMPVKNGENLEELDWLSRNLLFNHLWKDQPEDTREFLLNVMKNAALACDWVSRKYPDRKLYLIPSLFDLNDKYSTKPGNTRVVKNPETQFDLNFSESFLPNGLFTRLVAYVVSHAFSIYPDDSVEPILSQTRAVCSFGVMDFQMDVIQSENRIHVGVAEAKYSKQIIDLLLLMFDKLKKEFMGSGCELLLRWWFGRME
jgi:hypothetical protein